MKQPRFGKAKPMPFAPKVSSNIIRTTDLADQLKSIDGSQSFNDTLNDINQTYKNSGASTMSSDQLSVFSSMKNIKEMSLAFGLNQVMNRSDLSAIEYAEANDFNREKLINDQQFKEYLKNQFKTVNTIYQQESALDEFEIEDDEVNKIIDDALINDEIVSESATIAHDVNMYASRSNIFKKQERSSFQLFEEAEITKQLNQQSLSPKSVLEKINGSFWQGIRSTFDKIRNFELKLSDKELDAMGSDFINGQEKDLNWEDAPDAYFDNNSTTFEINANSADILQADFWKRFDSNDSFAFIQHYWENTQRAMGVLRNWIGFSKDQFNPERVSSEDDLAKIANQRLDDDLHKINVKWDEISPHLREVEMLHLSIMPQMMFKAIDKIDMRNNLLDATSSEKKSFTDKMVTGYKKMTESYLENVFSKLAIKLDNLKSAEASEKQQVLSLLKEQGVLNEEGAIIDSGSAANLDSIQNQPLKLEIAQELNRLVNDRYSLISVDETQVHNKVRKNIMIENSDGQFESLSNVLDKLFENGTVSEDLDNMYMVYNKLLDIHTSMTGISIDSQGSDGAVVIESETENGISVKVSHNAQWEEWVVHEDDDTGEIVQEGYELISGKPLFFEFKSIDQANAFKDKVRQTIALLEPVLGVFPDQARPLKVLVDNSVDSDSLSAVTENDDHYRMSLDHNFSSEFIKGSHYREIREHFTYKASAKIMKELFAKSIMNRMLRDDHRKKVKEYKEEQEEFEKEEIREIKARNRAKALQRKEEIRILIAKKKAYMQRLAHEHARKERNKKQKK